MSKILEVKFSINTENQQELEGLIEVLQSFIPREEKEQKPEADKPANRKRNIKKEETSETETIQIEGVRALVSKKAKSHRSEIKEKLTFYEASNVTGLDSKHYPEFVEFLNKLK